MFNIEITTTASLGVMIWGAEMTVVETNKSIGPSHHQVKPLAPYSPGVDRSIVSSIVSSIVAPSIGQVNQENSTAGNDKLLRTKDDNVLRGKADQDQLLGGAGRDRLLGSRGQDYLHGSEGNDRLLGRAGQDQLIGGSGNDVLLGHKGDDRLFGQSGRDHLRGGRGHDQLNGGTGHDRLFGGTGCDRLIDKDGGDRLVGGAGNDEFWIGNGVQGVTQIQDFQVGRDRLRFMQLGITYEDLTFERQDRHTVISVQDQQLVHLKNIYPSQLQSSSFDFGDTTLIPTLKTALDTSLAPGATLAVVMGDGSVWSGAAGIADLENGTPMSVDATMDIGSITKPMVAVTLLQLMQEDRVSLDDTLGQWLPDVSGKIENSETITLRQLLNHSSGIPDFLDDDFLAAIVSDPDHIWMPEDFLQLAYGESSDFAPGERHSYSNTNYTLLGLIIEAVTGDTLAGQLRSRIFAPLGMNDSSVVSESSMPGDFLRGYLDLA
ncbi:MAG: serine hydrolase, partial [Cyanobacteria bacterium P01_H01_bin.105]